MTQAQIQTLRNQARAAFLEEEQINVADCTMLINSQNADGSWIGIDYSDHAESGWEPMEHLENLTTLAKIFHMTNGCDQNDIRQAILRGLQYWYVTFPANTPGCNANSCECATTCPCSGSWYTNHIGKQLELQRIGILMYDQLISNSNLTSIINDLPTTTQDCNSNRFFTGANLTNVAGAMIARALLANDQSLLNKGYAAMESALDFAPYPEREGIQHDFSFHQHGRLLYNGGYGQTFLEIVGLWGFAARNTNSGYSTEARKRLYDYVLNGSRWMTVGNHSDYSVNGRYIARRYPANNAALPNYLMNWIRQMAQQDHPVEAAFLEDMRNNINTGAMQGVAGNAYFWKSDYVAHQERALSNPVSVDYFSSVKMCSDRTIGTESVDHENLLGYWLPFGATFVFRDGNEYIAPDGSGFNNIFPYMDWAYVPGVTCPDYEVEFEDCDGGTLESLNESEFVGSASNGRYSTTVMQLDVEYDENPAPNFTLDSDCDCEEDSDNISKANFTANKAWFHFGREIIALGKGINSNNLNLHTTINQSLFNNTPNPVPTQVGNTNWVTHDGISYILPNGQTWITESENRTGSWNLIDGGCDEECPVITNNGCGASGTVYKTYINHVGNNNSYYYIIAPGQDPANYLDNTIRITELEPNNQDILGVRKRGTGSDDIAGIVYLPVSDDIQPDLITVGYLNNAGTDNPVQVSVNHPCALLFDESNHEICISSPDREYREIVLRLVTEDGTSNIIFTLPRGEEEGKSKCIRFSDFNQSSYKCTDNFKRTFTSVLDLPGVDHDWFVNGTEIQGQDGATFTHTFTSTGIYNVKHVIDVNGIPIESDQNIEIYGMLPGLTISSNQVISVANGWNPETIIAGDLVIEGNAHVTISQEMTLHFCGEDSKLIIQPGSTLTLHGKLTDLDNKTWGGVQVWGNMPFTTTSSPIKGKFFGMQTGIIEHAFVAIQNGAKDQNSYGGFIQCNGTRFINNRAGIVCQRSFFNNGQRVYNCDFEINDDYPFTLSFRDFIYLSRVLNFQVKGSRFTNKQVVSDADSEIDYGVGIRSYGSGFVVGALQTTGGLVPTKFKNLGYGISAHPYFSPQEKSTFTVQNSEFNYCFVGIRNAGVTGSRITYNTFNMGSVALHQIDEPVQSGICYEGSIEGFTCEENYFYNNYSGLEYIPVVGIFCDDTGTAHKEIRSNTFDRMTVGNLANDINGNNPMTQEEAAGLTYLCNTNTNVRRQSDFEVDNIDEVEGKFDIQVTSENGDQNVSFIRSVQGVTDLNSGTNFAAGNLFSEEDLTNLPNPDDQEPATGIFNINTASNVALNYWYFEENDTDEIYEIPGVEGAVTKIDIQNENTCGTVLFAPPCCDDAVKDDFKEEYYQNKSAYTALAASIGTSPTPAQTNTLAAYRSKMDRAAYLVVMHEKNDTLGFNPDSLYTWVGRINTVGAELWLSKAQLANGNGAAALNILDNIPSKHSLSSGQSIDLQRTRQLTQLLMSDNLDSLSTSTLETLSTFDEAGGQTEFWAKNILTYYGAHYSPEYVFASATATQNQEPEWQKAEKGDDGISISVSPNPAKDFVNFRVQSLENTMSTLEIIDISGRILVSYPDLSGTRTIDWNTKGLSSGIYFYRLQSKDGEMESGKIIISK